MFKGLLQAVFAAYIIIAVLDTTCLWVSNSVSVSHLIRIVSSRIRSATPPRSPHANESTALSHALSRAMQPSRTVPFLYRGVLEFDQDELTITTLVTVNRFAALARLVANYPGSFLSGFTRYATQNVDKDRYLQPSMFRTL